MHRDLVQASFRNCIIDGSNENEIFFDQAEGAVYEYVINYSLLKLDSNYWNNWNNTLFQGNILSEDINFLDHEIFDFQLDSNSLAINSASLLSSKLTSRPVVSLMSNPHVKVESLST